MLNAPNGLAPAGGVSSGLDGVTGEVAGNGAMPVRNTPPRDDVLAIRHICTSPGRMVTFGTIRPLTENAVCPPEPLNRLGTVLSWLITITGCRRVQSLP